MKPTRPLCFSVKNPVRIICFLVCCLSIKVNALDEDGDGMSDVWQRLYNINTGDTDADPDADGHTNIQEARSGTNPHDNEDYFKLTNYNLVLASETIDLTWRSLEGRPYEIQKSRDLISWQTMHDTLGVAGTHSSLLLGIPPFPLNDQYEGRQAIPTGTTQTLGNNMNASFQSTEPQYPHFAGEQSVWWTWKATVAGEVTITTVGSDFDTTLAIYTGDALTNLVSVGSNDDKNATQSSVTFIADPTVVYSIQVNGYGPNKGNIVLNHPVSAGTSGPAVTSPMQADRMFFRVKGDYCADLDIDDDGLVTWEESLLGTLPDESDTDSDGMSDSFEFIHRFDPLSPVDGAKDADSDDVSNADEELAGTNPRDPNSK